MLTNNSFTTLLLVSSGNISDLHLCAILPSLVTSTIFDSGLLDSLEATCSVCLLDLVMRLSNPL